MRDFNCLARKPLCPGYIHTEMLDAVPPDVMAKSILPLIPVGRLGEPGDVARRAFPCGRRCKFRYRFDAVDQWRTIHGLKEGDER
jgi:NAD(P)-dependent dehydrogenase (short-subunit alcohol dehydrogenase family)